MSKPIACIVAYPSTTKEGEATTFDMKYYLSTHMTMIDKYWAPHGMKSWSVAHFSKESSLDGSTPPYLVQTTIHWDSVDDLKKALSAPESTETGADVANFTNTYPTLWISEETGKNTL